MSVLLWIAAAWIAAACVLTIGFLGSRHSPRLHAWLFGENPSAEIYRLPKPVAGSSIDRRTDLAA